MRFFKIFLYIFIITFILIMQVYGYVGYEKHPMEGNSIFPLADVNIKLSEIKVLMESKELDASIKVTAEYTLENIGDEKINFKVAFPVESNCVGCTKMPDDFKIFVDGKLIQTFTSKIIERALLFRMTKEISLKNAGREVYPPTEISKRKNEIPLIVWEISFNPKEKKIITNTYTLEWYLDPGAESLWYNLSPLYLWKGSIEKAYFKLVLPQELIENIKARNASKWPKISIYPKSYKIVDNSIEWFIRNLKQKKIGYISVDVDYRKPGVIGD